MNKNIKIAKELIKLAKNLIAQDIDEQIQTKLDIAEKNGDKYILHHQQQQGLWRIMACKNFSDVKKGDFGGLIQSEDNLSQKGNCWAYKGTFLYDKSFVCDNAKIYASVIYDSAIISGDAEISDGARIYGRARVSGKAKVYGTNTEVYGKACIFGNNTEVFDGAKVFGVAYVRESTIHDGAKVTCRVKDRDITKDSLGTYDFWQDQDGRE